MKVATWGTNDRYESGTGTRTPPNLSPVSADLFGDCVEEIAASYHFLAARLADGTVKTVGGNVNGELGDGTHETKAEPVDVGLVGVTKIAASGAHCIALLVSGQPYTWGGNAYGTLGNGTSGEGREETGSPTPVYLSYTFRDVYAGGANCLAQDVWGGVWAWGEGKSGQIGDGVKTNKSVPTLVGLKARQLAAGGVGSITGHVLALRPDGRVAAWGANAQGQSGEGPKFVLTPQVIPGLENISKVIAGSTTSLALTSDGTLLAWGKLPSGVNSPKPTVIAYAVTDAVAGYGDILIICDGAVFGVGQNDSGQLGDGTREDKTEWTEVPGLSGVSQLAIGQADGKTHVAALHNTDFATDSPVEVAPLIEALRIDWTFPETSKQWTIRHRLAVPKADWTQDGSVPFDVRQHVISGLESGKTYEVYLQNGDYGWRIVRGTVL